MYKVIDNFLSDIEFKAIQAWTNNYENADEDQHWHTQLLNDNNEVEINKPKIKSGIQWPDKISEVDAPLFILAANIQQYLNIDVNKLKEFRCQMYRYKHGAGILLHRDSDGENDIAKRYGITYYVNDIWKHNWGGELVVYHGGDHMFSVGDKWEIPLDLKIQEVIVPKANRLVIIEDNWHKVNPNLNKELDRVAIQTFIRLKAETKFEKD